jgi:hypothetical protein
MIDPPESRTAEPELATGVEPYRATAVAVAKRDQWCNKFPVRRKWESDVVNSISVGIVQKSLMRGGKLLNSAARRSRTKD